MKSFFETYLSFWAIKSLDANFESLAAFVVSLTVRNLFTKGSMSLKHCKRPLDGFHKRYSVWSCKRGDVSNKHNFL